ncbi:hypothetical protein K1719_004414 [Acacia pycnantha]|nr:hypothetical protein K1719_004414 [Acacia pycnantha]
MQHVFLRNPSQKSDHTSSSCWRKGPTPCLISPFIFFILFSGPTLLDPSFDLSFLSQFIPAFISYLVEMVAVL